MRIVSTTLSISISDVEWTLQEYNTEAAFSASVLLSTLALATLGVKEIIEQRAGAEKKK